MDHQEIDCPVGSTLDFGRGVTITIVSIGGGRVRLAVDSLKHMAGLLGRRRAQLVRKQVQGLLDPSGWRELEELQQ